MSINTDSSDAPSAEIDEAEARPRSGFVDVRAIERLREAALEHGEVADLLDTLASSFPFLNDGDTSFHGGPMDLEHLKSAVLAAAFAQYDRDQKKSLL